VARVGGDELLVLARANWRRTPTFELLSPPQPFVAEDSSRLLPSSRVPFQVVTRLACSFPALQLRAAASSRDWTDAELVAAMSTVKKPALVKNHKSRRTVDLWGEIKRTITFVYFNEQDRERAERLVSRCQALQQAKEPVYWAGANNNVIYDTTVTYDKIRTACSAFVLKRKDSEQQQQHGGGAKRARK
jgi:hypothetical protein